MRIAASRGPIGAADRARRRMPWLALVLVGWLAACNGGPTPPPTVEERLDLVAQVPVAAAFVELERPAGATAWSVEPLRSGLLVRTAADAAVLRVAWLSDEAFAGAQVRVSWERPEGANGSPDILAAEVLTTAGGTDHGASVLVWRDTGLAGHAELPPSPSAEVHGDVPLQAAFADYVLGDVTADGTLGVRDALLLHERLTNGGWSDHERYHGDLDGDGVSDVDDVALLLERLTDPTLPTDLLVRPNALSFVQLSGQGGQEGLVLVANRGRQAFTDLVKTLPPGAVAETIGGVPGQSEAVIVSLPPAGRVGWRPGSLLVSAAGSEAEVQLGHFVALIAGQSNAVGRGEDLAGWPEVPRASVRILSNDYRWRNLQEPSDDANAQVDDVSFDNLPRYSFATVFAQRLNDATGLQTFVIPSAKSASTVTSSTGALSWSPPGDRLDRTALFGSANFRAQVSAALQANPVIPAAASEGGPVNVVVWYQGESDATSSTRRGAFVANTNAVMDAFATELGVGAVYVQLASNCVEQTHVQQHAVAESQRRMEVGSGAPQARSADFHMVVAFDLPRSDCIHLSAYGQRVLAERIELAVREHVLGMPVDGTGPRLTGIGHSGTRLTLRTTRVLASEALEPGLFTVFDGWPSGSVDDVEAYGQNRIAVTAAERDPADPTAVRLTLASTPTATPYVRYMGLPNQRPITGNSTPADPDVWASLAQGVVRAAEGALPLPTFGPLPPF